MKVEPDILSMSLAEEMPILNVNIQGDYPTEQLKTYAEILEDRIEKLDEIKEVDILGAQDEEIEVAVDIKKMTASKVSFEDILSAIAYGNRTIAAGNIVSDGQRRTLRIIGEIESPGDLKNFVIKNEFGPVYLEDVAEIIINDINIDIGIANPTNNAFLNPRKNINTVVTKKIPKRILFTKSSTWLIILLDMSLVITTSKSEGNSFCVTSSTMTSILLAALIRFLPDLFFTASETKFFANSRA